MFAGIETQLRPLVAKLLKRYPGVRIVWANLHERENVITQNIRYQGTKETLVGSGLLTEAMWNSLAAGPRRQWRRTEHGDSIFLCTGLDDQSVDGAFDLMIFTRTYENDERKVGTYKAKQVLDRTARKAFQRIGSPRRAGGGGEKQRGAGRFP